MRLAVFKFMPFSVFAEREVNAKKKLLVNNSKRASYILLLTLLLFFDCERTMTNRVDPDSNELIAYTNKSTYARNEVINFTIQNNSDATAFFAHCGNRISYVIHRVEGERWINQGGWGWPCRATLLSGRRAIGPGSSYSSLVGVDSLGIHRILFLFNWQNNDTKLDSLHSNEFGIQ
jgi:hypothetical protein